jgi:hypothetical protein
MNVSKTLQLALLLCGTFSISAAKAMEKTHDLESLSTTCKERGFEIIEAPQGIRNKIFSQIVALDTDRNAMLKARKHKIENYFNPQYSTLCWNVTYYGGELMTTYLTEAPERFEGMILAIQEGGELMNSHDQCTAMVHKHNYFLQQSELEGKEEYEKTRQKLEEQWEIAHEELLTFYGEGEKPILRTHFFSLASDLSLLNTGISCTNPQEVKDRIQNDTDSILGNAYASDKDRELAGTVRDFLGL